MNLASDEIDDAPRVVLPEVVTRLRRALRGAIRASIPWERLPMAQVELLQDLTARPGQRVSELAASHRLAANTVSTVVQQMVTTGLVERSPDATDRRAVVVRPTAAGHEALAQWAQANSEVLDEAFDQLTPKERAAIASALPALARLADSLEQLSSEVESE